jgi:hypothetical protein
MDSILKLQGDYRLLLDPLQASLVAKAHPGCLIAVTSGTMSSATRCLLVIFKRSISLSQVVCYSMTSVQDVIDILADLTKPSSPSSTAVASPPPPVKHALVDDSAPPMLKSVGPATSTYIRDARGRGFADVGKFEEPIEIRATKH